MTFPTFSAALRALEESNPHLLSLPMNDPLIRASFEEVERQQLDRVRYAARNPENEYIVPFRCVLHPLPVEFETWTDLWVHVMSCGPFRARCA